MEWQPCCATELGTDSLFGTQRFDGIEIRCFSDLVISKANSYRRGEENGKRHLAWTHCGIPVRQRKKSGRTLARHVIRIAPAIAELLRNSNGRGATSSH